MKKYLIYICMLWIVSISCSNDDNLPNICPSATGEYTDERDRNTYEWVRLGNQEWMASNLKYGTPYYDNEYDGPLADGDGDPQPVVADGLNFDVETDFDEHGNLYTWEEALYACPEGWHLPTDEDWQKLEITLGMSKGAAASKGWRGQGSCHPTPPRRRNRLRTPISGKCQSIRSPGILVFEFLKRIRLLLDCHRRGKQRFTRNNRVLPEDIRKSHNRLSGCRTFEYFNAGSLRARRTKELKTNNKKWRMTEKDFSISHKNRNDRIVILNHHL